MKVPKRIDVKKEEMKALLKRVESKELEEGDYKIIKAMAETISFLSFALEEKKISIRRLLNMLFGVKTEKTKNLLKGSDGKSTSRSSKKDVKEEAEKEKKLGGHGRNGAGEYEGAERIKVTHPTLKSCDRCPVCPKGKVYEMKVPGVVVRVVGRCPLQATVYELQKLRCNLCGKVFTAELPEECGSEKYNETAGSMIALLKYGSGFPFKRLEGLQESFDIPLAASTQWEVVERKADRIYPVYDELVRQAAQGEVLYNDDTTMKILELMKIDDEKYEEEKRSRSGMFTTGILSVFNERKIALFFTGRKHAGENMMDLLKKRESDRSPPIQMCDALSRNLPKDFKIILANCLCHARRKFAELTEVFPEECRFVLETFKDVYKNDHKAKEQNMSPEERLRFHQSESGPLMEKLKTWLNKQLDDKKVEPNSSMGQAISYTLNHWEPLTLFLRVPKAPLDNNLCEQALKRTILHRKNALFYKTQHGAYIGDLFMSIIHTCNLSGVNPFEYLTALEKHSSKVFKDPKKWLPWNYEQH
ncbi:MAG: IS66 family transposase [Spirochaeta sp.]|nr:IS66 family transposase [Spirochaeta sp.]